MTNIETIHDAKEPSKDVKQLVDDIVYSLSENIGNQKAESITALITAHDDEIRRECAEKVIPPIKQFLMVEESFNRYETEVLICRVQAAIIGKEVRK